MYIRFVTDELDPDSTRPQGVFAAAYALRDSTYTNDADKARLNSILSWFERNLPAPKKFDRRGAIFWFKSDARACTRKLWELVLLLRSHSRHVNLLRTRRPEYIFYEDQFQVGAIPFRDTV